MAFFQNAYYTCNCEKGKCGRDCFEFRKMTHTESNGDMIRAMTDEQLATFLNDDWHDLPECRRRAYNPEYGSEECYAPDCKDCWLDWLQQEAKDGE